MMIFLLKTVGGFGLFYIKVFVVRASSEEYARQYAADEDGSAWLDKTRTSCKEININGIPGVIYKGDIV